VALGVGGVLQKSFRIKKRGGDLLNANFGPPPPPAPSKKK